MSRSYKKTPVGGNCCGSDKYSKRIANRNFRHNNRIELEKNPEEYQALFIEEVRHGSMWDFKKDGKQYFGQEGILYYQWRTDEWLQFWTKEDIKKAMRK